MPNSQRQTTPSPLRRRPKQARARERVDRILDTAEAVFAEIGYDAATTNLIATRAETSVGSLYEFFPNKEALAAALADRYIDRIGTLYDSLIVDEPDVDGVELVERIVAGIDGFYRDHPGAVPLLNGRLTSPDLARAGQLLQNAMVDRVERLIATRRPDLAESRVHLLATVLAEIARSLLALADSVPGAQRPAVVRELERAVIGYLEATAPLPEGSAGTASPAAS